jgi:hypothetical protein
MILVKSDVHRGIHAYDTTLVETAGNSMLTQQTIKKLLDYWKHGRHAAIRGFVTPPSYNTRLGSADRVWRSSCLTLNLSEHMSEFVTGPRLEVMEGPLKSHGDGSALLMPHRPLNMYSSRKAIAIEVSIHVVLMSDSDSRP